MKFFRGLVTAFPISLFMWAMIFFTCAHAQNAITLPYAAQAVADIGSGPVKVRVTQGNASIFTAQGSGIGSTAGASTSLTLTATPTKPPIIGGLISGNGIVSGTTVTAYNGTTGVTLSAAATVPGGTAAAWGAACPSSAAGIPTQFIQASVMADYYLLYTQARVCAISPGGPANTLLILPVFYEQSSSNSVVSFNGRSGFVVPAIGDYSFSLISGRWTLAQAPTFNANSILANVTSGAAQPTNYTLPACANDGLHAWTYTNGSGIICTVISIPAVPVTSVFGRTGAVVAAANDYTQCQITPNGVYNVKCYGAVGDAQIASDISCSNGSPTITSVAPRFVVGDVGKYILLQDCANGSAPLPATISTYNSSTSITISANAGATLSSKKAQWGTNSSTAFANAITAARGNGYVFVPCGTYITAPLNLTNWAGGKLTGAGGAYGCAVITPTDNFNVMVDMTGSPAFNLTNIQIGFGSQIGIGNAGYAVAPSAATPGIDDLNIRDVFVQGFFTASACYRDRIASSNFTNNFCFNYTQAATAAGVTFTNNNTSNVQSSFTTTNTNTTTMGCSEHTMVNEEAHGLFNLAGGAGVSANFAYRIVGCIILRWHGGNIDSSNTSMIQVSDANGTTPDYLTHVGTQFYSETPTSPTNIYGGGASAMGHIYLTNVWTVTSVTCANSGGCTRGVVLP